ncbi:MAG: hypothetical protein FLDDKLPJ_00025 [Phycisphaerae bacterium]|nr:hypothetical protein [Phycisphaerae bacterium]
MINTFAITLLFAAPASAAPHTVRMNLCATTLTCPPCIGDEDNDCHCNENNGNCKKWEVREYVCTSIEGDAYKVVIAPSVICYVEYRCALSSTSTNCTDDSECIKIEDPLYYVRTELAPEYQFVVPPEACWE